MKYFLIILMCILSSCTHSDQSKIDSVKNGIMNNYKSITVGQAFDKWKGCSLGTQSWSLTNTDNSTEIVTFRCGGNLDVFEKTHNFILEHEDGEANAKYVDMKSITYTAKWIINKDDSFELKDINIDFIWNDNKTFEWILSDNEQDGLLADIYSNEQIFSRMETNPYAGKYLNILAMFYSNAE